MSTIDDPSLAYQELHPDDILAAVESLEFVCNGRLLALNSYENRVYQIGIEDASPLIAKFYRPGRWSTAAILEEHGFINELAARDIPVVAPLRLNGQSLHHYAQFAFSLSPYCGGHAPELDDMLMLEQLGRLLGRIHLVGETADFMDRPTLDTQSYGVDSRDFLLSSGHIPVDIEDAYTSTCEHLFERIDACFERAGPVQHLRLHADFHPSNVMASEHRLHIVDFDDTRMGPAIQDLWMFLSGDRNEQSPQLAKLLEGYEMFRRFDTQELHLIEALRTLRIMHYAAWLARRWEDPAFRLAFPWFDSRRYWDEHVLALREQVALMDEEPLVWGN